MKYRPEIDGLRAVAVSLVILYHARFSFGGSSPFEGGYIGVDVFFVISGYLITSILLAEMASGRFTFLGFYERRARRILPALFVVMFASIPLAWTYVFPKAFVEYAGSMVAATLFVSNLFFWQQDAYTAEASALKPLLHTWSLSVEEQFYVLFPLALLAVWRYARRYITAIFIIGFLASLGIAEWASHKHPNASFFLLPTRGWELLAGAWLVQIEREYGRTTHPVLAALIPSLGMMLILLSVAMFSAQTTHPGIRTLVPVVGTMLVILFSGNHDPASRLLSSKVLVGIGLMSYSLYLWHQPIFTLARIRGVDVLSAQDRVWNIALTFFLAGVTWWFVERRFRNRQQIGKVTLWTCVCGGAVLLVAFGVWARQASGLPERFHHLPPVVTKEAPKKFEGVMGADGRYCMNRDPKDACILNGNGGRPTITIVGDSHARVLSSQIHDYALKYELGFVELTMSGCAYLPNTDLYVDGKKDKTCTSEYQDRRFAALTRIQPGVVIIHTGRLPMYLSGTGFDNGEGGIEEIGSYRNVHRLAKADVREAMESMASDLNAKIQALVKYGHMIVLVYPVPEVGWSLPQKVAKMYLTKMSAGMADPDLRVSTNYSRIQERTESAHKLLDSIGSSDRIVRVYPERLFCSTVESRRCETHTRDDLYYVDSHHLSLTGNQLLFAQIEKQIMGNDGRSARTQKPLHVPVERGSK